MPNLDYVRAKIERMRAQAGRHPKEIQQLQRAGYRPRRGKLDLLYRCPAPRSAMHRRAMDAAELWLYPRARASKRRALVGGEDSLASFCRETPALFRSVSYPNKTGAN